MKILPHNRILTLFKSFFSTRLIKSPKPKTVVSKCLGSIISSGIKKIDFKPIVWSKLFSYLNFLEGKMRVFVQKKITSFKKIFFIRKDLN